MSSNGAYVPRINIDEYPALKKWLDRSYEKLASRSDKGDTPYNLRDCAYMDDFNKQKICYSETNSSVSTKIAIDRKAFITDKTCFIITSDDDSIIEQLYMVMNSPIFTWYMNLVSPKLGLSGISLTKDTVQLFPAVMPCDDKSVYSAYSLTEEEIVFISSSDSP